MNKLYRCLLVLCVTAVSVSTVAQGVASSSEVIFSTSNEQPATQPSTEFTIRDILITGHNRTKDAVILREMPFSINETYPLDEIVKKFYDAKERLMNTGLFRNVVVNLKSLFDYNVVIQVDVEEKWYLYPLPFVKVVDGKFGQWWNERGRSLDQLNYGLRLTQYNATGRNDNLYVYLMSGYTQQVAIDYKGLALDPQLKWSAGFSLGQGKNREINYITENNRMVAAKSTNGFMRSFSYVSADISYRPAIKTRHTLSAGYFNETVADTISKLNASFTGGSSNLRYPRFTYTLTYNGVDFIPYPTKGLYGEASLSKVGLSSQMNMWQLSLKGNYSIPVGNRSFMNMKAVGVVKLPFDQPYIHQQFIGHNDLFMQGYENFIIDGVAGGYAKVAYHHPVLNLSIKPPQNTLTNKLRLFNPVPVKVYAKAFGNAGYVYNAQYAPLNTLNNRMLYSGGVGLDIIAFADLIFKVEYSFNQLGQNGIYLHQRERF